MSENNMILLYYYLIINLIAFAFYGIDKLKAQKHLWRIPENTLFLTAFLGGAVGSLCGMRIFHHKTKKLYFWILNILACVVHAVILFFVYQ